MGTKASPACTADKGTTGNKAGGTTGSFTNRGTQQDWGHNNSPAIQTRGTTGRPAIRQRARQASLPYKTGARQAAQILNREDSPDIKTGRMPGNPAIQTGSFTLQIGGHNMHHNHVERGHNRQNYHSDRGYNIQTGGTQAALPYKKT